MATTETLSLDQLRKEYTLIFKKVHRLRDAISQAQVNRMKWANRYREWMMMQAEPSNIPERLATAERFQVQDPYPDMPEPDLDAEKRMAELHHLIAKMQREQSA